MRKAWKNYLYAIKFYKYNLPQICRSPHELVAILLLAVLDPKKAEKFYRRTNSKISEKKKLVVLDSKRNKCFTEEPYLKHIEKEVKEVNGRKVAKNHKECKLI